MCVTAKRAKLAKMLLRQGVGAGPARAPLCHQAIIAFTLQSALKLQKQVCLVPQALQFQLLQVPNTTPLCMHSTGYCVSAVIL